MDQNIIGGVGKGGAGGAIAPHFFGNNPIYAAFHMPKSPSSVCCMCVYCFIHNTGKTFSRCLPRGDSRKAARGELVRIGTTPLIIYRVRAIMHNYVTHAHCAARCCGKNRAC